MQTFKSFLLLFAFALGAKAQPSSEILAQLESFNSFKTVLYLAAHPDDENTRVISWLVNGEHARTGYLSLTRGDGGQNLIGTEIGEELGILRTRELLAARSIDGGEQFFTRAVDFGYSRSADETLEKWDEDKILADVVWVIRKFQPQLIITRFPPDERAGHGHHTASAMLAIKAFAKAADKNAYPEQLAFVQPWQVQSVYWNGSTWWDKDLEKDYKNDDAVWRADIGGYDPLTGKSYNELGSLARSQHKCQGFGVDIQRGETFEYFRPLAGNALPNGLASLQTPTWQSIGVPNVADLVNDVKNTFLVSNPEASLEKLAEIHRALNNVKDTYWRERKQREIQEIFSAAAGLYVEAIAENYMYQPEENVAITVNFLARLTDQLSIDGVFCNGSGIAFKTATQLPKNQFATYQIEAATPAQFSNPYWLVKPHGDMYQVEDLKQIGKPENDPVLMVNTTVLMGNYAMPMNIPVKYKWRDRVEGELQREIVVAPPLAINFSQPMSVNMNGEPVNMEATIKWFTDSVSIPVAFAAEGWQVEILGGENKDASLELSAKGLGAEDHITLRLTPKKGASKSTLQATYQGSKQARAYHEIAYSHIPTQAYMPLAEVNLVNINVQKKGTKVAYIKGAGDRVAEGIAQMGYQVDFLDEQNIATADLSQYQAIVVGIRAYNTQSWLPNYSAQFFNYVQQGGNFIVQYNTASRFLADAPLIPAPYPFELGRDRVTEEDAKVKFVLKDNPIFNAPNKITEADFDDWVQERGLYFASTWDDAYLAPIGWHDKNEKEALGGLIIAPFGHGNYVYTGISFFRELPAGVPGAYRLLANLISYESNTE